MKKAVVLLAVVLLLSGLAISTKPALGQTTKWTFMIYLDADNNLEDVGLDNFLLMAKVGSTNDVKIVVEFDRSSGLDSRYGDWTSTKRFLVGKDMTPDAANALQDLGELNMADPTTLSDFVKWSIATYPADRYFLDIWDHGLGWQGVATDDIPTPNDRMTAVELGIALADIQAFLGRKLDILANDACRMTLEIMYQASPYVEYLVGSEKDEPVEGWPYDTVLGNLAMNPGMGPVQLGTELVDLYVQKYRAGSSYSVTMALVNSSALQGLVSDLNDFVAAMNYSLPYFVDSLIQARNQSEHYEGNHCSSPSSGEDYDLYDVAVKAQTFVESGRVNHTAQRLKDAVRTAVIHEDRLDLAGAVNCVRATNATGLSLWYPWTITGPKLKDYGDLALSRDSLWDEHIRSYHNMTRPHVDFQASLVPEDRDSDGRLDNAKLAYVSSAAGSMVVDQYIGGSVLSVSTYQMSPDIDYLENISLPLAGIYDFYLSFRGSQGTMNATSFLDIQVAVTLTFRGAIRNLFGTLIDQANVKITNLRTGQFKTTLTSDGNYSMDVVYPSWLENDDIIRAEAFKDGRSAQHDIEFRYTGGSLIIVDLYLETELGGAGDNSNLGSFWPLMVILAASLALELTFIAFAWKHGGMGRKKRERRGPPY